MPGPQDSPSAGGSGRSPDPLLAQMVFEATWDLLTRWQNGQPIPAEAYRADFGDALFSRQDVGPRLVAAQMRARFELFPALATGPTLRSADPLLDLFGCRRPQSAPYPYFAPPRAGGEIGWFETFRVIREVGRGGLGIVFRAFNTRAVVGKDRPRALKLLIPEGDLTKSRQRLEAEAASLWAIRHDHVVAFYDAKTVTHPDAGEIDYLEMEYVYGPSLEDLVVHFQRDGCPVPLRLAVELIRQAAAGLDGIHTHTQEFIHRDLKPSNLLLEWRPDSPPNGSPWRVRLCDFGLVRAAERPRITSETSIVGTRVYMAPEQLRSVPRRPVSTKSDIFALGVILYELVVGRHPFLADTVTQTDENIFRLRYTHPREANRSVDIPESLDTLIRAMLAEHPTKRPDAVTVRDRLAAIADPGAGAPPNRERAPRAVRRPADSAAALMKVYVSSVAKELIPFRRAVVEAIRAAPDRYVVFPPQEYAEEFAFPVEECQKWIAQCHVYVGLFGFDYGPILKEDSVSLLEREYRASLGWKLTPLLFMSERPHRKLHSSAEWQALGASPIHALRSELETARAVLFSDSREALAAQVLAALSTLLLPEAVGSSPGSSGSSDTDWSRRALENYRKKVCAGFTFYNEAHPDASENDPSRKELPFLRSQQLFTLKPGVDAKEALHPERFRAARLASDDRSGEPPTPDAQYWEELDREALIASLTGDAKGHRIALTTDAGLGKTRNLAWLEHECQSRGPGWVFSLLAGETLPLHQLVPKRLAERVLAANNTNLDELQVAAILEAARTDGAITLIVDGLDQTKTVGWLKDLLDPTAGWDRCHVVVAGRPFALESHWEDLFAAPNWQYVQIGELNRKQQEQLLGERRFGAVPEEARSILSTPRVLECIRGIDEKELPTLRTVADVYWKAVRYMLVRALRPHPGGKIDREDERRYLQILGALAFAMYAETESDGNGNLRPNLDRILAGDDLLDFLYGPRDGKRSVLERLQPIIPNYDKERFKNDLKTLSALNAAVSHGWLDSDGLGTNAPPLLWRNASLQEFFAAYWVCRWDASDAELLGGWAVDPHSGKNRAFYWLWRYASEMPEEVIWPNRKAPPMDAWVAAMTPLYVAPPDKDGLPIRSSEFLYRSWLRPGAEGFVDPMAHSKKGREARATFLTEFPKILEEADSERQRIALELSDAFIPLIGQPGASGSFLMGSAGDDKLALADEKPRHEVTLSAFALHRYCVSNVAFELYDPWHRNVRWEHKKQHPLVAANGPSADDRCPVVNVSWYDAWCFARWLGSVEIGDRRYRVGLPSEAQWEYACRAGTGTLYWSGNEEADLASVARYGRNSGGHTHAVDEDRSRNPWGVFQIHGNVWEWCADWYLASFYSSKEGSFQDPVNFAPASARVLRGGSWYGVGRYCRSAARGKTEPDDRHQSIGFRLAAVPVVGAE
ncbi:Serine/threonine-protein kinase PknL [Gemmata sp. SH-PL17]|uniref:SUMF1/EgtB/PvdO family nonheme iron enzyme n=1 Tax=Gemmata sp. SH-PL17 TaxID=1630693 RepID=UPI00078CBF87|nr:SUMF1/EgtB/PvdO family nonheme iron enzyme [Gemmata sp. SH-PL17]AMV24235.1 Serine/threonine-protein kinase PknL [Gemmata sp. SH-PL17]